jgi:hypothetical protein
LRTGGGPLPPVCNPRDILYQWATASLPRASSGDLRPVREKSILRTVLNIFRNFISWIGNKERGDIKGKEEGDMEGKKRGIWKERKGGI